MGVKSIFKILISVPCIIILALVLTEYVNVSLQSQILKNKLKLGTDAAASLFEAENYKNYSSNSAQSPNKSDIEAADGTKYVSGEFYPREAINLSSKDSLSESIYNYMYNLNSRSGNSDSKYSFYSFVYMLADRNISLGNLYKYQRSGLGGLEPTKPGAYNSYESAKAYESAWTDYNELYMGYLIYKNRYTPLNMGICYLDEDTLLRMAKWEVTQMVSNCDSDNIVTNDNGEHYVQNHGFGIYVDKMTIEEINISNKNDSNDGVEGLVKDAMSTSGVYGVKPAGTSIWYLTFDLDSDQARTALFNLTGIDAKGDEMQDNNDSEGLGLDWDNIDTDIRRYFTVAFVKYKVPISYKGITPLTTAFNWLSHNQVKGISDTEPGVLNITYSEDTSDYTFISCYYNVD